MNTSETVQPLQDQTALVIHATTVIGGAITKALAGAGAKVMINYLDDREQAERLADQIRNSQGQAMLFRADVSQENQVKSMLDVLIAYWGHLDILVNNIGLPKNTFQQLMNPELKHENISLNLAIQFLRVREATHNLLGTAVLNTPASIGVGKIICVSSNPDINSKQGLIELMETLKQELSEKNIRVNGILPANYNRVSFKPILYREKTSEISNPISNQRANDFEDIAKVVVWMASDEADCSNGEIFKLVPEIARSLGLLKISGGETVR